MQPSMTLSAAAIALGIAALFAVWPIVGKITGAHGLWVAILVTIGSLLGTVIIGGSKLTSAEPPTFYTALILVGAGVLNGIGMYFYPMFVGHAYIPTAAFIATVVIGMVVMSVLFTTLVAVIAPSAGLPFPAPQVFVGVLVMCAGIYITAN